MRPVAARVEAVRPTRARDAGPPARDACPAAPGRRDSGTATRALSPERAVSARFGRRPRTFVADLRLRGTRRRQRRPPGQRRARCLSDRAWQARFRHGHSGLVAGACSLCSIRPSPTNVRGGLATERNAAATEATPRPAPRLGGTRQREIRRASHLANLDRLAAFTPAIRRFAASLRLPSQPR
jgi:hypothetical protein